MSDSIYKGKQLWKFDRKREKIINKFYPKFWVDYKKWIVNTTSTYLYINRTSVDTMLIMLEAVIPLGIDNEKGYFSLKDPNSGQVLTATVIANDNEVEMQGNSQFILLLSMLHV